MKILYFSNALDLTDYKVYETDLTLRDWMKSMQMEPSEYAAISGEGEAELDKTYGVVAVSPLILGGGGSKGKNIATIVLGAALMAATGGTAALFGGGAAGLVMAKTLGLGLVLSGGAGLLMGKMKMPSMDKYTAESTERSYSWNAGKVSRSRGSKGVTFGTGVIPEGELLSYRTYGANTFKVSNTQNDTETSSHYIEMLIGAGEGSLDSITDLKINGIPAADIKNLKFDYRLGTNNQQPFTSLIDSQTGIKSIESEIPLKTADSDEFMQFALSGACDFFHVTVSAGSWYLMNVSDGSKKPAYCSLVLEYRKTGTEIWKSGGITGLPSSSLSYISTKPLYFDIKVEPEDGYGAYEVRLKNTSAVLNKEKGWLSDTEFAEVPDRAFIHLTCNNAVCYSASEQAFPNTALLYLRLPASEALSGSLPNVTWKQNRANIIVKTQSGYETRPADNLAWAVYDILAQIRKDDFNNSYHVCGENPDNIDLEKFEAFAGFCETIKAKGNWFLNRTRPAWEHAQDIATSCRAFIGLRNGKVSPFWDEPVAMSQIFTSGNIVAGSMTGGYISKTDRATAIEASFNDEQNDFKTSTIRITEGADDGSDAVRITFAGLSHKDGVYNQARYLLRRNKYLQQTVSFKASIDSIVCELGDVIGIQSDVAQWGAGGRILEADSVIKKLKLDTAVTLETGKNYGLLIRHQDGTLERRKPDETEGVHEVLTFSVDAFTAFPAYGDVYSFGVFNAEVKPFRVEAITREDDLTASIECIEYNENVYAAGTAPKINYTSVPTVINSLTALSYTDSGAISIGWNASNAKQVQIYINDEYAGAVEGNNFTVPALDGATKVKVIPIGYNGKAGQPMEEIITPQYLPPPKPQLAELTPVALGAVAKFDNIPQGKSIVWLIVSKDGKELAKQAVIGDSLSVYIPLPAGVSQLEAVFVNSWNLISAGLLFSAEPSGIDTAMLNSGLLEMPGGSVFSLGLKGCTTESIKEVGGIKDVSGCGNHGQAFGAVEVVTDPQEGQVLHITGDGYCQIPGDMLVGDARSFKVRFKVGANSSSWVAIFAQGSDRDLSASGRIGILYDLSNQSLALCVGDGTNYNVCHYGNIDEGWHTTIFTVSLKDGVIEAWLDGIKVAEISLTLTAILQGGGVFLGAIPSTNADLYVSHGSVYNYKLSPAQIKTLFMFPQEALFAQLGADTISANAIGAKHLVKTEALITEEAQISTGLFDKIVVGSSSYQATKTTATNAQNKANAAQAAADLAETTATNAQNKANAAQAAADLAEKRYTYEIDLTGSQYDPNIYYPITFSLDTDKIKIYTVKAPFDFMGVPWSTHSNPDRKYISAEVSISAIGEAWGGNPVVNYLRLFNYKLCPKPPIYAMTQCRYNSKSVFFLRGGAVYVLDTPVQGVPRVYTELTNIHISDWPWHVAPVADPSSITAQRTDNSSVVLKIFDEKYVHDWVTPGTTTIDGGSVTTGTVTALQLAALCVTAAKIAAEAVTTAKLAANAVTTAKLAANAVTTAKLATDAIKSLNYIPPASGGTFAQDGSFLDLANGSFSSKGFSIDSSGNAYFAGDITGSSGTFYGSLRVGETTYAPGIVLRGNPIYIDLGVYCFNGAPVESTISHYLKIVFDGGSFSLDIWVGRSFGRDGSGIKGLDVVARGHVGGSGGLLTVEAINNVTDKRCYLKISNYEGKGYGGNHYLIRPSIVQLSGPDITQLTTAPSGTMQVIEKREIAGEAVVALEGGIIWSTVGGNQSYRNSGTLVLKLNNGKMFMIGMWPYASVKAAIMTFPVPFKNATYSILAYHAQMHLFDLEFSEKTTSSIRVATRDDLWLGGVIWFAYGDY